MKIKIAILILLMAGSFGLVRQAWASGDSDSTYLDDYINSFEARVISYTPNLWRLDADSSNIIRAINDAMKVVDKLRGATEAIDTIIMDSSFWYDLNDDFQSVNNVTIEDPKSPGETSIDSIIMGDIGKNTSTGSAHVKYYTIWNRQIYFDRNNFLTDTLYIYYNAYAKSLSKTDTLSNVSRYYFNIIVDHAILFFYTGRVGAAVPQILALADKRLVKNYADMKIPYTLITPDVR